MSRFPAFPVCRRPFLRVVAAYISAAALFVGFTPPAFAQAPEITATGSSDTTVVVIGRGLTGATGLTCTTSNSATCANAGSATINAGGLISFHTMGYTVTSAHVVRLSATCQ